VKIGEQLSHYRIVDKLGEGGMGVVYRAEDVRLGRPIAVKVLAPNLASNSVARRRFEAEARAASALDHPNICALHDVGETPDGGLFLALAYCEGETLREMLERGPLEPARALAIAAQVADGLAEAHDKGIVHRDVKPANLMVRRDGLVKILDFGVAKLEHDAGITGTTDSVGSPAYMAPEQIRVGQVGPPADLWSLGVVLFEMLSGRRPFEGGVHAVLANILNDAPPSLDALCPGLHPNLSRIVARALNKDPGARYQGARELAAALRAVDRDDDDRTRAVEPPPVPVSSQARRTSAAEVTAAGSTADETSLAVLPFTDMSPGHDQDWFCEGLAEELITALSEVSGLRVASRASTLQFRDQDPRATGEKLQVGTLLTGSVRKAGNRLRITTQLVRVADGSVLSSSRHDHDLDDVFALQEAIARAAVDTVLSRMGERVTLPRVQRPTGNIEAYNLYLKGRFHWNRRSVSAFRTAIPLFEQAIELDPEFAAAYVGLADTYLHLALFNAVHPRESGEHGKELCRRALALDPEHAEARTTLATFQALSDWDWGQAETELRRVLARTPDCTKARQALALYVMGPLGRFDDAITEMRAALSVDPISIPFNISLGFLLHFARRSQEALAHLRGTLELGQDDSFTRIVLSEVLGDLGRPDEGIEVLLTGPALPPGPHAGLALCYARAGRTEEARSILAELLHPPAGTYTSSYFPGLLCIRLGELAQALELLERAVEEHAPSVVWMGVRPAFDPLRDHPRFQNLLARLRLPNLRPAGTVRI
jgi:serine/threonine-protein kinase